MRFLTSNSAECDKITLSAAGLVEVREEKAKPLLLLFAPEDGC